MNSMKRQNDMTLLDETPTPRSEENIIMNSNSIIKSMMDEYYNELICSPTFCISCKLKLVFWSVSLGQQHQHLGACCKYRLSEPSQTYPISNFSWGSQKSVFSQAHLGICMPSRAPELEVYSNARLVFLAWWLCRRCYVCLSRGTQCLLVCNICNH